MDVPDLSHVVTQRGKRDCVIAALATTIQRSYEDVAKMLRIQLDDGGRPVEDKDVDIASAIYPLFASGWLSVIVYPKEAHKEEDEWKDRSPTSDVLKHQLLGLRAVIGYKDPDPEVGPHALAWDGERAIDCGDATFVSLDQITLEGALILVRTPRHPKRVKT